MTVESLRGGRRILVVEDDTSLRRLLGRALAREGCEAIEAVDGREAIALIDEQGLRPDLILTDLEMPHAGGLDVLAAGMRHQIPVVILTGKPSVEVAVQSLRSGAANFLTKPFSQASLHALLDDAFGAPSPAASEREPPVHRGFNEAVAQSDATVLIRGESGTGKEVLARAIHDESRRAAQPFVAVNCGAIPEGLLESELFGHVKGAFTGATQRHAGKFQLADTGTLLLDEIGDMPLGFQVRLLRVLQERQIELLGEGKPFPIDVRIIAVTHRDLGAMVANGTFRQDLYYRLNVIEIVLPPLRDRKGDIPALVEQFLALANQRHRCTVLRPNPAAMAALDAYRWPGNIRQLSNAVERAVVIRGTGELTVDDLPRDILAPSASKPADGSTPPLPTEGIDLKQLVADFEESLIQQAISQTSGNRNAAAHLLGINRTTLVEKLRRAKPV